MEESSAPLVTSLVASSSLFTFEKETVSGAKIVSYVERDNRVTCNLSEVTCGKEFAMKCKDSRHVGRLGGNKFVVKVLTLWAWLVRKFL